MLNGFLASVRILRSEEGRQLRALNQANVSYIRAALFKAGVGVEAMPSHIIPVHVGYPALCSALSDVLLLQNYVTQDSGIPIDNRQSSMIIKRVLKVSSNHN